MLGGGRGRLYLMLGGRRGRLYLMLGGGRGRLYLMLGGGGGRLLGDSGVVVNSLGFCPASLKSLGCFYFRCVLSSQWKAVTVNLRILYCQR